MHAQEAIDRTCQADHQARSKGRAGQSADHALVLLDRRNDLDGGLVLRIGASLRIQRSRQHQQLPRGQVAMTQGVAEPPFAARVGHSPPHVTQLRGIASAGIQIRRRQTDANTAMAPGREVLLPILQVDVAPVPGMRFEQRRLERKRSFGQLPPGGALRHAAGVRPRQPRQRPAHAHRAVAKATDRLAELWRRPACTVDIDDRRFLHAAPGRSRQLQPARSAGGLGQRQQRQDHAGHAINQFKFHRPLETTTFHALRTALGQRKQRGALQKIVQRQQGPDLRACADESTIDPGGMALAHGLEHRNGAFDGRIQPGHRVGTSLLHFPAVGRQCERNAPQPEIQVGLHRLDGPSCAGHLGRDPRHRTIFTMHGQTQKILHRACRKRSSAQVQIVRARLLRGIAVAGASLGAGQRMLVQVGGHQRAADGHVFQVDAHRTPVVGDGADTGRVQPRSEDRNVTVAQVVHFSTYGFQIRWRSR